MPFAVTAWTSWKTDIMLKVAAVLVQRLQQTCGAYHERPSMRGIFSMFGVSRQILASISEGWCLGAGWKVVACLEKKLTDAGCGLPSAAGRAKLWLLFLEAGASRRAECSGNAFQWPIKHAGLSAIFLERVSKRDAQQCRQGDWADLSCRTMEYTCRQANARYTQKTLSFSKTAYFHELAHASLLFAIISN